MGWTQGGRYFYGKNFLGAASCYDPRGCFHLVGLSADRHSIDHMVQGSRSPFPVAAYSINLVEKAVGVPTITFSTVTGYLRIYVPLENAGLEEWAAKQEDFPDPSGDEPPPVIVECQNPYHEGYKLKVFAGTLLGGMAMYETAQWPDSRLNEYYNALAEDVNAERNVSTCKSGDPYDPLTYWQFDDPQYLSVIKKRMDIVVAHKLTEIFCLTPYGMPISDERARWLIRELKPYLPYIVFECVNEPTQNAQIAMARNFVRPSFSNIIEAQRKWVASTIQMKTANRQYNQLWTGYQQDLGVAASPADFNKVYNQVLMASQADLVAILKSEGVPNKFIQIEYVDSGDFYNLLHDTLNGEGLATYHWTGTMESVHAPWPKGWSTSSGMMQMMKLGMYGSNDGQDTMRAAHGLNFWLHDHQDPPITEYRRPNNEELHAVKIWMEENGKGSEDLSASAYQQGAEPNMDGAINIGRGERLAMK